MKRLVISALALGLLTALAPARAETVAPGEPRAERRVAEDAHVRIEESRLRGESQRIVVQPKGGAGTITRAYEIVPSSGARDPSQRGRSQAGARVWQLLSF